MEIYEAPINPADLVFTDGRYDHAATEAAYEQYEENLREEILRYGTSDIAGKVIRTPFADGYAEYMVAKIEGRTALVAMQRGDAWRDARFERTVTVKEIREKLARVTLFG